MKLLLLALLLAVGIATYAPSNLAHADDAASAPTSPSTNTDIDADDKEDSSAHSRWAEQIKTKYNLTDVQLKSMTDAGLEGPGMAKTAALAQASGQPLDKIIQMRTTEKMGWGKIAKTLGVHPSTIGHAVSDLRHEVKADRKADKAERKADKAERKEERRKAREERREQRREEKAQRKTK